MIEPATFIGGSEVVKWVLNFIPLTVFEFLVAVVLLLFRFGEISPSRGEVN